MSREKLLDAYHRFVEANTEEENSAAMQDICKAAEFASPATNKENVDELELFEFMEYNTDTKSNSVNIINDTYGNVSDVLFVMAIFQCAVPMIKNKPNPVNYFDEFKKMVKITGLGTYVMRMNEIIELLSSSDKDMKMNYGTKSKIYRCKGIKPNVT